MLSTYVDDLTLSGPADAHEAFWAKLTKMINVEPPEPIFRVLGRNHVLIDGPAEPQKHDLNAAVSALKGAVAFDMNDDARQTVTVLFNRHSTREAPEGNYSIKALWLGRLARPDIIKPIGDLATAVQKWSRNHDRQLARLIAYVHSTTRYRLVGVIKDNLQHLHLALYADADYAGEMDAKSTSGGVLVLKGPNTHFPLAWFSKRQASVSRSTTEAGVVSLTFSLYQDSLPSLTLWERLLKRPVELVLHEDNQATILVAKKGYSQKMRHTQRSHKVNLSALAEQLEPGTGVVIKYVATDLQAADIFTKALQALKWDHALKLLGIRTNLPEKLKDVRPEMTKQ